MLPKPPDHNDFCIRTLYRPSDVLGGDMIGLAHAEQVIRRCLRNLAAQASGVERDDQSALLVSYAASRSSPEPSPRLQSHV